jgi:uncharacterized C2H2 Zn-finger protein
MGRFSYLFPKITDRVIEEVVKEEKDYIKELNKAQMWEEGTLNVDKPQKEKYAKSTIIQKKKKARYDKTEFITLRWMGDFYDSLKVLVFSKYFTVSSDSLIWAKFLEPQDRFTKALGLTEESKGKLSERLKDRTIKWLKNRR